MAARDDKRTEQMRSIARLLYENPTADHQAIADALDLTLNQVKHALDEMRREEHAISGYVVNLGHFGFPLRYRVDISVVPANLREGKGGLPEDEGVNSQRKLAQYIMKKLPARKPFVGKIVVEDVKILLGSPADLSATVRARDTKAILEFVTEGLRMCSAVAQTSSCLEAWSCRDGVISAETEPDVF